MHRRDFKVIAGALNRIKGRLGITPEVFEIVLHIFVEELRTTNASFNEEKFRKESEK